MTTNCGSLGDNQNFVDKMAYFTSYSNSIYRVISIDVWITNAYFV